MYIFKNMEIQSKSTKDFLSEETWGNQAERPAQVLPHGPLASRAMRTTLTMFQSCRYGVLLYSLLGPHTLRLHYLLDSSQAVGL